MKVTATYKAMICSDIDVPDSLIEEMVREQDEESHEAAIEKVWDYCDENRDKGESSIISEDILCIRDEDGNVLFEDY